MLNLFNKIKPTTAPPVAPVPQPTQAAAAPPTSFLAVSHYDWRGQPPGRFPAEAEEFADVTAARVWLQGHGGGTITAEGGAVVERVEHGGTVLQAVAESRNYRAVANPPVRPVADPSKVHLSEDFPDLDAAVVWIRSKGNGGSVAVNDTVRWVVEPQPDGRCSAVEHPPQQGGSRPPSPAWESASAGGRKGAPLKARY